MKVFFLRKFVGDFEEGVPKGKGYYKNTEGQKIEADFVWVHQKVSTDGTYCGLTVNDEEYGYFFFYLIVLNDNFNYNACI